MSESVRRELVEAGRKMLATGLTNGTSGNLSARADRGFLITPSGVPYDELEAGDLVLLDWEGEVRAGRLVPSSEWRIHRDIYLNRSEVAAVVHAHPPMAMTVACLRETIPAIHYMIALVGGDSIRCAPYATFGTAELSRAALQALAGRKACLLANHGMVAVGRDVNDALRIADEVEVLAGLFCRLRPMGGGQVLSAEEIAEVAARFARYGQPAPEPS